MDKNFDDTIHTVYSSGGIYNGNYYPFQYTCVIKYANGDLQLIYPFDFEEKHEIKGKKHISSIDFIRENFKDKQLIYELADLLNCDLNSKAKNLKKHILNYRAIVDSENEQEAQIKAAHDLLALFKAEIGSLNQFIYQHAISHLRDEIITDCYNQYIKEIVEKNKEYVVTATYLNNCVNGIMKYLDPLLTIMMIQGGFRDMQDSRKFFKAEIRKFLLVKITSSIWPREMLLTSPLEEISDLLFFLEESCAFLHEYHKELEPFTSDEKLEICVRISSSSSVEEKYHSFRQRWSSIHASYGEDMIKTFDHIQVRMMSDKSLDFHKFLSRSIKHLRPATQLIRMDNFSSIVFLALLEMIRKGDASKNSNSSTRNTYIIKCRCCGRFFIPERSNICYCDQKAPGSDKTCSEVGAKQKHRQNRTDAEKKYATIKTRIEKKITDAAKVPNNNRKVGALREKQSKWEKQVTAYNERLIAGTISDADYITSIERAYDNLFKRKQDSFSLEK